MAFNPRPFDKNRKHTYSKSIQDIFDYLYEVSYGREIDNSIYA
jgi:hypothetical protein